VADEPAVLLLLLPSQSRSVDLNILPKLLLQSQEHMGSQIILDDVNQAVLQSLGEKNLPNSLPPTRVAPALVPNTHVAHSCVWVGWGG